MPIRIVKTLLVTSIFALNFLILTKNIKAQECEGNSPPCHRFDDSCRSNQVCGVDERTGDCFCHAAGDDGPTNTPIPTVTNTPTPTRGPIPPPYVPCNQVRPTEFHSLRPYQASPCNQNVADIALFCGNDLLVYDRLEIIAEHLYETGAATTLTFEGNPISADCTINFGASPDGFYRETCRFSINRQKNIAIDLQEAYLPIMGNTELVVNSQEQPPEIMPDSLDNPAKVNEYISWYLNGINGRAEYDPPDPNTEEGIRKIVDYSGPLKKLLAWDSQITDRLFEQSRAGVERHNQIVGCGSGTDPRFCYPSSRTRVRLTQALGRLFPYIPFSSTEDRKGEVEAQTSPYQIISPGLYLTNVFLSNQRPAELFFAHMQESFELSDLLQQTLVPDELER
ncbi:MAG: hypothetical protein UT24_C0005G0004 [Candidatus Woesebacteria bacterium GW2011_GWB1_39_12]|uniref:Uncharacterized protein n=2 Tax=Candidatus Woeseibacteriota TaxID=1752722 RepID=A0A0G0Q8F6_9BACT|nr:MAG: hypothetical protein UT23_C0006G0027 [Candidatus Woesebacteria bacterium GW2011_GWA1_39_12]KKR01295.1 MAG: hypothetical protein UT24_C0005G0004 [Candidatus Woesebacteria bacterium GW2011_GWB1_39_12]